MAICGKYDFPVSKIDGDRLVDAVEENGYGTNEYGSDPSFPLSECLPLLSIGQMIELLNTAHHNLAENEMRKYYDINRESRLELSDALWEAVKQVI